MSNLANIDNPTEEQEQMAFVQWLRLKGYAHFRVPNETYTKSFKQKAKNKVLGVSSGVPDLFVVVPRQQELWNGLGTEAIRTCDTITVPTLVAIEPVSAGAFWCYNITKICGQLGRFYFWRKYDKEDP